MANEQTHSGYDAARNLGRMRAARPAAWPTGVSLLAQMVDACQRCDATDDCDDRMAPGKSDYTATECRVRPAAR